MIGRVLFFVCLVSVVKCGYKFPDDFKFGVASSAYQVEGAWDEDGKGESMWDRFTHSYTALFNNTNGDIACDSYHHLKEDIAMLKELKVDHYRFSISWSRLMPKGLLNVINPKGVAYYNNLIDELLANNIEPLVTMYHWDLPQSLADVGGLYNPRNVEHFVNYADFLFKTFGDRVKYWATFNEPKSFCQENVEGLGSYMVTYPLGYMTYYCANTVVLAHANIYHLYNNIYRAKQGGKISLVLSLEWDEAGSYRISDLVATERRRQFDFGLYFNPIVYGDYPKTVIYQVAKYSKAQGFKRSRLPEFTAEEKKLIKGTYDFVGLNQYSAWMIKNGDGVINITNPSFTNDYNAVMYKNPDWPSSPALSWLKVAPKMLRKTLNWIKNTYKNPEIFITENGYADLGGFNDTDRINYIKLYLEEVLKAIHIDKVKVTKYTYWSMMDSYEWISGYTPKFGLYNVDFNDPNRTRTPKESASYYRKIIETHEIPEN